MSLANCLAKLNAGKTIFDQDEIREINQAALQNIYKGTGKDAAERLAVQTLLDAAIAERQDIIELIEVATGVKAAEPEQTKAKPEEKAVPRKKEAAPAEKATQAEVPSEPPEPAAAEEKPEEKDVGGIQDFGEKLGGSRKDKSSALSDAVSRELTDEEIASMPLSKIWPKGSIDEIEDPFVAAVAHSARAEIPTKPQTLYKVKAWVEKVKMLRGMVDKILRGDVSKERFVEALNGIRGLTHFHSKVSLLENVDRENWDRIGKVEEYPEAYRYDEAGNKIPSPIVHVQIDRTNQRFAESSVADVLDKVREALGEAPKAKRMEFEVRGRDGAYFINKKGDSLYRKLKTFDAAKEAISYRSNNYDDLVSAWEAVKDSDNVKESDVRRGENRPRSAQDWRNGKDVTPELFQSELGFRGVEFGNWVSQGKNAKDRQGMLNAAYDSLMDLADIIGVPPKALSLNGTLGLGFGSRGSGKFAAHFESDMLVINLTKTRGAGSLAHEWFHALDNYFQSMRGKGTDFITNNPENYYVNKQNGYKLPARAFNKMIDGERDSTYGTISQRFRDRDQWELKEGVRTEVAESFADLVKALNDSPMAKRASLIDKGRSGGYWSRIIERGARSFENYIIHKMALKGFHNDYLANVTSIEDFQRDAGRYPYLLEGEIEPVATAFDNLFATIQTKETDKGVAMFSRSATHVTAEDAEELLRLLNDESSATIKSKELTDDEADIAEAVFLSDFPAGTRAYSRRNRLVRSIREASDAASNDIGGDAEAERVSDSPLGPFTGYRTTATIDEDGTLNVEVWGKEQIDAGLKSEPALTFNVSPNGELVVNGPSPLGRTFKEFERRGWAERATVNGKEAPGWTRLTGNLPLDQVSRLLGEVHARSRLNKRISHIGLHWQRATGMLGLTDANGGAVFFSGGRDVPVNPHTPDTLRSSIAKAFSPKFIEKLEQTGRFVISTNESVKGIIGGRLSSKLPTKVEYFDEEYPTAQSLVDGLKNGELLVHARVPDGTDFKYGIDPSAGEFLRSTEAWQTAQKYYGEGPELIFFSDTLEWAKSNILKDVRNGQTLELVFVRKDKSIQKSLGDGRVETADGKVVYYEQSYIADYESPNYKAEPGGVERGDWYTNSSQDVVAVAESKAIVDNPDIQYSKEGRPLAFYDRDTGITHILAENIPKTFTERQIKGLLSHEIGEHALQLGKTDKEYQAILRHLELLVKLGNKDAVAARKRAIDAKTPAADMGRETMGYLVEAAPQSSIVQRFMTWFKSAVNKVLGPARLNWAYTPADMATMAQSALRRAPEMLGKAPEGGGALGSSARKDWYRSALADAISTVPAKVDNTSGNNWATWITANASKLGVKKEEIQWSGITDYLAMRGKDRVSKEDVAAFLNESGVKVQDVVLGGEQELSLEQAESALQRGEKIHAVERSNPERVAGITFDDGIRVLPYVKKNASKYIFKSGSFEDAMTRKVGTKYDQYVLPGGENYREMLITLPVQGEKRTPNQIAHERYGKDFYDLDKDQMEAINSEMQGNIKFGDQFKSSHFDQPNILAHLRFDDRVDADGKRVLFINEIQSDWAQMGRKEGFADADSGRPVVVYDKSDARTVVARFKTGLDAEEYIAKNDPKMERLVYQDTTGNGWKFGRETPSAPFVTDTKAWVALALKRAIAHAAENGYDKVAIINGEQAAGLYDLSKQVKEIDYIKRGDKYELAYTDNNGNGHNPGTFSSSELEGVVGKEVAQKIVNGEGKSYRGRESRTLEGVDLKVGGEGMHKFYNEIVPQVANEVLRKIGGGKVETVDIDQGMVRSEISDAEFRDVTSQSGFAITDAMRENAAKGLPLFSKQDVAEKEPPATPEETRFQKTQRIIQDKLNRFTVIKEWLAENGVKLSEAADVHKAEERMHSKFANQAEDFREKRVAPLIQKIQKAGFSMDTVAEFLHAQHAEEANKHIAKINPEKPDGGSGMMTEKAREILKNADPELASLANEFRKITDDTRDLMLREGIIPQEMVDAWEATYKHYVPLKGGPDAGIIQGTGKGLKAKRTLKRRTGHGEREGGEWIIENILADYERALMLVEKNRVGQSLIRMIMEIGREDIGTIGKPEKRGVIKPDQAAYIVNFNGSMVDAFHSLADAQLYVREESMKYGRSKNEFEIEKVQGDPSVHYMASPMLADNEVNVYVKGHAIRVQINDELLARAYGNMGAEALNTILQAGRSLNGFLSKIYTGYNPEFIATNIVRDLSTGIINITGEQGIVFAGKSLLNYAGSFKDLLVYAATGKETKWITDYRADGGNTGAAYLSDLERLGSDIKTEYAAYLGTMANLSKGDYAGASRAAGRTAFNHTLKWIEHLNQAGENAMRLSIYKAARESNQSRNKASSLAKNSTVNFNRKGEMGAQANALYLFFNAGVQGTASLAHAHFKGEHKYQAWGLSTAMASLGYLIASSLGGGDEDEYDKLSDYTKSRNMVIKAGDGWVKIPVPYGYGFFWNTGRAMADAARKDKWGKAPWHMASSFVEEFTPFGAVVAGGKPEAKQLFYALPTAVTMTGAPIMNRSGMGGPIMPEGGFDKSQPDRDKMWRTTKGTMYDSLAGALEKVGADVSPETLKHYTRSLTGGAGALVDTSISSAMLKAQGADLEVKEMPFVRKFYGETSISDSRRAYYEARDEAKSALEELNRAKKARDMSRVGNIITEKRELIALAKYSSHLSKAITAARDRQDEVRLSDIPVASKRLSLKQMEKDEEKIYDRYLEIFKDKTRGK